MTIAVIDCDDSFVNMIVDYVKQSDYPVKIIPHRHALAFMNTQDNITGIILSPGPNHPQDYPHLVELLQLYTHLPLLGICLGHQLLGYCFSENIIRSQPTHGQASAIFHQQQDLFLGIDSPCMMARYHSLAIEYPLKGDDLQIVALTEQQEIMAVKHRIYPFYGVQFHPESILSPHGKKIIENFIKLCSLFAHSSLKMKS